VSEICVVYIIALDEYSHE